MYITDGQVIDFTKNENDIRDVIKKRSASLSLNHNKVKVAGIEIESNGIELLGHTIEEPEETQIIVPTDHTNASDTIIIQPDDNTDSDMLEIQGLIEVDEPIGGATMQGWVIPAPTPTKKFGFKATPKTTIVVTNKFTNAIDARLKALNETLTAFEAVAALESTVFLDTKVIIDIIKKQIQFLEQLKTL